MNDPYSYLIIDAENDVGLNIAADETGDCEADSFAAAKLAAKTMVAEGADKVRIFRYRPGDKLATYVGICSRCERTGQPWVRHAMGQ